MSRKAQRYGSITILLFMAMLGLFSIGCTSFSTPLLSTHDKKITMIITKPPMRLYVSGSTEDIHVDEITEIIQELDNTKYYPYKFNDSFNAKQEIGLKHDQLTSYKSETKMRIKK